LEANVILEDGREIIIKNAKQIKEGERARKK